ncbi:MAG TPA: hypothetical protein VM659_16875 [Dongiaceae bacterium]|nr:hypothetical protein [Dongiaceae bacterium]
MHEDFLSYIMIGLSRGLFPAATHSSRQFDEEAYLMREAAALYREKRAEAARQRPLKPSEAKPAEPKPAELQAVRTKAAPESGVGEPAGRQRIAFWRRGAKISHSRAGLAGGQPCCTA